MCASKSIKSIVFSCEPNRCYGGGHSPRGWQRGRLATSFETKESVTKRKEQLSGQQLKTKTNRELIEWDKELTINNNFTTPSYNDIKANPIVATLYNKLKFAKALLKEWKIRF